MKLLYGFICLFLSFFCALSKKNRFFLKDKTKICEKKIATGNYPGYFTVRGGWTSFDQYPRILGDVNGDGFQDIVGFGYDGVYYSFSNFDGTFKDPYLTIRNYFSVVGGWTSYDTYPRFLCDVNGDGKDDIVAFGYDVAYVTFSYGTGFGGIAQKNNHFCVKYGWYSQKETPRACFDVDGDGYADLVGFAPNGVYVAYSDGFDFGSPYFVIGNYGSAQGGWTSFEAFPRCLGNYNSCNGPASIIGFGGAGVWKSDFQSLNYFNTPQLVFQNFGKDQAWTSYDRMPRACADWDGDGIYDLIGFHDQYAYYSRFDFKSGKFQNFEMISSILSDSGQIMNSFDKYPRFVGKIETGRKSSIVAFGEYFVYTINC